MGWSIVAYASLNLVISMADFVWSIWTISWTLPADLFTSNSMDEKRENVNTSVLIAALVLRLHECLLHYFFAFAAAFTCASARAFASASLRSFTSCCLFDNGLPPFGVAVKPRRDCPSFFLPRWARESLLVVGTFRWSLDAALCSFTVLNLNGP